MALCGGFICTKNALTALNTVYIIVAIILIAVGVLARGVSIVTSVPVVAGIIAVGVFLLLVAILGLYGASRHHQVVLFFYMVILFLIFLIQFFVAVACLAVKESQVKDLVTQAWHWNNTESEHLRMNARIHFNCCEIQLDKTCRERAPCKDADEMCEDCFVRIPKEATGTVKAAGAIGLFFSFTEAEHYDENTNGSLEFLKEVPTTPSSFPWKNETLKPSCL